MTLGPVTKLGERNKKIAKKLDDDVMSGCCDVIAIFPIYSQFGAIRKQDSGRIVFAKRWPKNADFLQKMLPSAKLRGPWY